MYKNKSNKETRLAGKTGGLGTELWLTRTAMARLARTVRGCKTLQLFYTATFHVGLWSFLTGKSFFCAPFFTLTSWIWRPLSSAAIRAFYRSQIRAISKTPTAKQNCLAHVCGMCHIAVAKNATLRNKKIRRIQRLQNYNYGSSMRFPIN
jgi:hypothetical protein